LDSCVVIYLLEGPPELGKQIFALLSADKNIVVCTSGIVRLECIAGALKQKNSSIEERYRHFLGSLETIAIDDAVCDHAAQIRATFNILLPDALHLALAEKGRCDEFWTSDVHFKRVTNLTSLRVRIVA
jgi:predicted nucleic acid-binding protein